MRDGIFVGYRMHTGGVWTGQYQVIDVPRCQERRVDQNDLAYDHGINEIYVPGDAADDKEEPLQFPVRSGLWKESVLFAGAAVNDLSEYLRTTDDEVLSPSQRAECPSDNAAEEVDPPDDAGGQPGGDSVALPGTSSVPDAPVDRKNRWQIKATALYGSATNPVIQCSRHGWLMAKPRQLLSDTWSCLGPRTPNSVDSSGPVWR